MSFALAAPALAQDKVLHIGLREDPDLLDPTLGSSYVGRIVFEGMCDKLFDIDTNLNIVPQLATGYDWKDPTHLVIHLRAGVHFQDGEQLDRRGRQIQADARPDRQGQHAPRRGQLDRQHRDHRSADDPARPEGAGVAASGRSLPIAPAS